MLENKVYRKGLKSDLSGRFFHIGNYDDEVADLSLLFSLMSEDEQFKETLKEFNPLASAINESTEGDIDLIESFILSDFIVNRIREHFDNDG